MSPSLPLLSVAGGCFYFSLMDVLYRVPCNLDQYMSAFAVCSHCIFVVGRVRWGDSEMAPWGWQCSSVDCQQSVASSGSESPPYAFSRRGRLSGQDCVAIMESWRNSLAVGDRVNAEDSHHKWYEASVISADHDSVCIRFLGWSPKSQPNKYDEIVPRDSRRLLPFTSKIRDWRRIQVGDEVIVERSRVLCASLAAHTSTCTSSVPVICAAYRRSSASRVPSWR